jgi:NADH-quinone oxidoreductase subunit N
VILWACVLLLVDLFVPKERKAWTAILAAVGMIVALGLSITQTGMNSEAFGGMIIVDGFAQFLTILVLGSGLVAVMLSYDYLTRLDIQRGEYYVLLMFSISGMILMALAADLIVIFLALELLSIPYMSWQDSPGLGPNLKKQLSNIFSWVPLQADLWFMVWRSFLEPVDRQD